MISENLKAVQEKINICEINTKRPKGSVKLVAVSKRKDADLIIEAHNCGQVYFGENYLQEALTKIPDLPSTIKWHFIGNLQSNKVKKAVEFFNVIETVDSLKIAKLIEKHSNFFHKQISFFVQVNIGKEKQKAGVDYEQAKVLLEQISLTTSLKASGLMVIPPFSTSPEDSRPYFRAAKQLADELAKKELFLDNEAVELSMGMSGDFIQAIEEGATIIRVGTAIFGTRE
jgi:pyridoxal phosphate enzyme (YggS family)